MGVKAPLHAAFGPGSWSDPDNHPTDECATAASDPQELAQGPPSRPEVPWHPASRGDSVRFCKAVYGARACLPREAHNECYGERHRVLINGGGKAMKTSFVIIFVLCVAGAAWADEVSDLLAKADAGQTVYIKDGLISVADAEAGQFGAVVNSKIEEGVTMIFLDRNKNGRMDTVLMEYTCDEWSDKIVGNLEIDWHPLYLEGTC